MVVARGWGRRKWGVVLTKYRVQFDKMKIVLEIDGLHGDDAVAV